MSETVIASSHVSPPNGELLTRVDNGKFAVSVTEVKTDDGSNYVITTYARQLPIAQCVRETFTEACSTFRDIRDTLKAVDAEAAPEGLEPS